MHRVSEFAGVRFRTQQAWIREGIRLLRSHGLNPRVWVAPRHGFDSNTLKALHEEEISILSDGLARVPFLRAGITWIPQQIWEPVEMHSGVWTICIHPGSMDEKKITSLRAFLMRHSAQFTSVDRLIEEIPPARRSIAERIHSAAALSRIRASRIVHQIRSR
jgi:predicted deacetylase